MDASVSDALKRIWSESTALELIPATPLANNRLHQDGLALHVSELPYAVLVDGGTTSSIRTDTAQLELQTYQVRLRTSDRYAGRTLLTEVRQQYARQRMVLTEEGTITAVRATRGEFTRLSSGDYLGVMNLTVAVAIGWSAQATM